MSGLEILGIAASVIQIVDLGARLSVKLFVFSRKIKSADKSIEGISQDIAVTGAILQQLGDEISKDENADLITKEAVTTTKSLISGCQKVFTDLDSELDGRISKNTSVVTGWKSRMKFALLEAQVDLLRSNLERLKSSLLLMLNVLTFAVQVRSHRNVNALKDHRALVETLIKDKNASDKKYQQAKQALEWKKSTPTLSGTKRDIRLEPPKNTEGSLAASDVHPFVNAVAISVATSKQNAANQRVPSSSAKDLVLPVGLRRRIEEIQHHGTVIEGLLLEVQAPKYKVAYDFRDKLHQGILRVHWEHWSHLREVYRDTSLMEAFSRHPEVVRYWLARLEREALGRSSSRINTGDHESVVGVQSHLKNTRAARHSANHEVLEVTSSDWSQRSNTPEQASALSPKLWTGAPRLQKMSGPVQSRFNTFVTGDETNRDSRDSQNRAIPHSIAPSPPRPRTPQDVMRPSVIPNYYSPSTGVNTSRSEVVFPAQSLKPAIISPYANGKPNDRIDTDITPFDPSPQPNYRGSPPAGAIYDEHRRQAWRSPDPNSNISAVPSIGTRTHVVDPLRERRGREARRRREARRSNISPVRTIITGPLGENDPDDSDEEYSSRISKHGFHLEDDSFTPLPPRLTKRSHHQEEPERLVLEERSPRRYLKVKAIHNHFDDDNHNPQVERPSPPRNKRDKDEPYETLSFALMDDTASHGPHQYKRRHTGSDAEVHGIHDPTIEEALNLLQSPSSPAAQWTNKPRSMIPENAIRETRRRGENNSPETPPRSSQRKPLSISTLGRVGIAISRMAGSKRAGGQDCRYSPPPSPHFPPFPDSVTIIGSPSEALPPPPILQGGFGLSFSQTVIRPPQTYHTGRPSPGSSPKIPNSPERRGSSRFPYFLDRRTENIEEPHSAQKIQGSPVGHEYSGPVVPDAYRTPSSPDIVPNASLLRGKKLPTTYLVEPARKAVRQHLPPTESSAPIFRIDSCDIPNSGTAIIHHQMAPQNREDVIENLSFGPIESSFDDYIARWTQISSTEYRDVL